MAHDPSTGGGAASLTFSQQLRALRETAGLSQEELAERARVSTDAVSALERGTRTRPYPATVRALANALGLAPQEASTLAAAVPKRLRPRASGRNGAGPFPGSLPTQATPLLGRDEDVAAVADLLSSSGVRLVTLTGIGGIGKTRLAVAAAERVGAATPDGVAFVPLAPVLDDALVWPEVGRALGVDAAGRAGGPEEILDASASLEMLLVLDNCEHLPGTAGVVADLLGHCSGLTLLVTSRAPLRLRAETEYAVPPLPLPELSSTLASLDASPAAALLIGRGRAVRRDLVVRPEDAPAVAGICHRLAGLPLALELAGTGLRVLDPVALLSHLDEVLARSGPVDLPARQRTMRATLDWSYGLLSERDQSVFRRLSVFLGGFTLEAAEVVVGGPDVLGAVERLTAQSLCFAAPSVGGGLRYGMLEPVAQYARSLLDGDEETTALLAHAEYFVEHIERASDTLLGPGGLESLRLFDVEEGNLWSALDWTVRTKRGDLASRFTWALFIFWLTRGRQAQGRRVIARVLALQPSDALRARVLHAAAALSDQTLDSPEAVEGLYVESVALAQRSGDREVEAPSAIGAGLIALEREDPITAERRLQDALSAAQQLGERGGWSVGLAHTWLAMARRFRGDAAGAVGHAHQALDITGRRGDMLSQCLAFYNLAHAELDLGQPDQARAHLVEAAELCQQTRDASQLAYVLDAVAAVELAAGGRERVPTLLGAAEALRESGGSAAYRWYGPDVALRRRTAEHARSELGEAAYRRALDAGHSLTLDGAVEFARRRVSPSE